MSLLRKLPNRFLNPQSALKIRFFAAQPAESEPFPDVPTSAYYDDLVNRAGSDGDLETVRLLLNKRIADGCFNTKNTFKFVTRTESSLSNLDDLFNKTLARVDKGLPRKQACESVIARLCKIGTTDEALRLVDQMARGGYGLTASTFHPILRVLARGRTMDEAWRVVDLMRELKAPPDLTAYNYLLTSHCFKGNLTAANDVLEKIEENKLGVDARTYDALVLGACRAGKVEGALALFRRMAEEGQSPLHSTYHHVVAALLKAEYYAQAVSFVMICANKDKKLDTYNFGCLASKLISLKRVDEAKFVLEEMSKRDLRMLSPKLSEFYVMECENK